MRKLTVLMTHYFITGKHNFNVNILLLKETRFYWEKYIVLMTASHY